MWSYAKEGVNRSEVNTKDREANLPPPTRTEQKTVYHQQPDLAETSTNKKLGTAEARPTRRHRDCLKYTRHPFRAAPLCVRGFTPLPPRGPPPQGTGELGYHLPWYRQRDLKDSSAGPSRRL